MCCAFPPGEPIENTVEGSLKMLDSLPDLDFVLIEDFLFTAPARKREALALRFSQLLSSWSAPMRVQA